ncbi:MAG: DNA replication/repair protein RecF [Rhodospirillaceae bacterium]|nr:DNA replication/repair protein RecF [Rhodospirillaceae bacterium]MEA4837725.1 DNA replication/repair protein RecF [Rhodospirillaceae bacterium]
MILETPPGPLAILRLALKNFRCYPELRLECDARPAILTGPNGAGKTNILEAFSFLAPGRGLRRSRMAEVARTGAEDAGWAVAVKLRHPSRDEGGMIDIGTGCDGSSERRLVRIDGRTARTQSALSETVSVLWLTPAMDRLFTEGAGARRRFLDRLVLGQDPAHAARASAYDRAMRERARLLREGRADPVWLNGLEERMAQNGTAMALARKTAIARLNRACQAGIGPFPAAELAVSGATETALDERGPDETENALRRGLAEGRRRDADAGVTLLGPHRSDLAVRLASRNLPAGQCSTGEQKAVLVAIILGQARIQAEEGGMAPILLLDEIAAHLDGTRRAALFDELVALGAQSWLTGTDQDLFAPMGDRGQFFHVEEARIQPAPCP